jgi:hypothetical protein
VITMHVVVRPPQSDKSGNALILLLYLFKVHFLICLMISPSVGSEGLTL